MSRCFWLCCGKPRKYEANYSLTKLPNHQMPSVVQEPHDPAGNKHQHDEHSEAISAVAKHVARRVALGDAVDDGGEECERHRGCKMRHLQTQDHCFFPIAMW